VASFVYLIDGSSPKIKVGNQIIQFKHSGPRALLGAGTHEGVALQAIRAFGPDHLTDSVIRQLGQNLPSEAKTGLKKLGTRPVNTDAADRLELGRRLAF
jgi:hypothetical protein